MNVDKIRAAFFGLVVGIGLMVLIVITNDLAPLFAFAFGVLITWEVIK